MNRPTAKHNYRCEDRSKRNLALCQTQFNLNYIKDSAPTAQ